MRNIFWAVGLIILLVTLVIVILEFWGGGNYYLRALTRVGKSPVESREQIKDKLYAANNEDLYGGIFSGILLNRVWVWGESGLKPFYVDEYSIYFYKDGCSEEAKQAAARFVQLESAIYEKMDWEQKVHSGDYVVVRITAPENGGTVGNLREIHAYNYWPFLRGDLNTLCAK